MQEHRPLGPPGQAGNKRPREEGLTGGPQQGNGKRAREAGRIIKNWGIIVCIIVILA